MTEDAARRLAARERAARKEAERLLEERARELFFANKQLADAHGAAERLVEERTRELKQAMLAAESASRAKTAFLARISHELRTPLTAILGFSDELKARSDAESLELLNIIERNGSLLLALVEDLLDFAAIDAEKLELDDVAFDIRELVREVHDTERKAADRAGLTLERVVAREVPRLVRGDPRRLRQVLLNLVSNAIKYTKHGQVSLVLSAPTPGHLRFDVTDTGIGIPEEHLDSIFDAFQQIASIGAREGVGLGLAIVKRLVDAMRGEISVTSALGRGSRFQVTLPLVGVESRDRATSPARSGERLQELEGVDVLVADDSPDNRLLIRYLLERRGATVRCVDDGRQAVDAVTRHRPQIVLMDLQMPELDGLGATRELRAAGDRTPILVVTANALDDAAAECREAGAADVLTKPLDKELLVQAILRALEGA